MSEAWPRPTERARVRATVGWHRVSTDRPEHRDPMTAYSLAVIGLLYGLPTAWLSIQRLRDLGDTVEGPGFLAAGCGVLAVVSWVAVAAGRARGPLTMPPFLMHVLGVTDLAPLSYLGRIAARRVAVVTGAIAVPLAAGLASMTRLEPARVTVVVASAVLVAVVPATIWLCGQVLSPLRRAGVVAAVTGYLGAAALAAVWSWPVALVPGWTLITDSSASPTSPGVLGGLAMQLAATVGLAWSARQGVVHASVRQLVDDGVRWSQAQVFIATGTFHHALDLYRPTPRAWPRRLLRADGGLHGPIMRGALRAVRTPQRSLAAIALIVVSTTAMTLLQPLSERLSSGAETSGWVVGSLGIYIGSGWIAESWRGLRDELSSPPLYGPQRGGVVGRHLAWPAVAVGLGVVGGWMLAQVLLIVGSSGFSVPTNRTLLLGAAALSVALSARFLREMKSLLPIRLLTPIPTDFGDLSAIVVRVWQVDSLLIVAGVMALVAGPLPLPAGAVLAVGAVSLCVVRGLKRTRSMREL